MGSRTTATLLSGNVMGAVGDDFVIAEWRDPGGPNGSRRPIAPVHLHHKDAEAWYVVEGKLCVQVGDDEVEAHAGCGVFVPKGTPHTYWNPGPDPVRYLLVMTSNIYGLIQGIHALKERTPVALQTLFKAFDSELLDV